MSVEVIRVSEKNGGLSRALIQRLMYVVDNCHKRITPEWVEKMKDTGVVWYLVVDCVSC